MKTVKILSLLITVMLISTLFEACSSVELAT